MARRSSGRPCELRALLLGGICLLGANHATAQPAGRWNISTENIQGRITATAALAANKPVTVRGVVVLPPLEARCAKDSLDVAVHLRATLDRCSDRESFGVAWNGASVRIDYLWRSGWKASTDGLSVVSADPLALLYLLPFKRELGEQG